LGAGTYAVEVLVCEAVLVVEPVAVARAVLICLLRLLRVL
jgi:hypothetical protein